MPGNSRNTIRRFRSGRLEVITAAHHKGGSGKTSLICSLAAHFALNKGMKVLLIDLDPQANSTNFFLDMSQAAGPSVTELLDPSDRTVESARQAIYPAAVVPNLDVMPATEGLEDVEEAFIAEKYAGNGDARVMALSSLIREVEGDYSLVLVDTHPARKRPLNLMALAASTWFICPVDSDVESFRGLNGLISAYREINSINPALKFMGCVYMRFRNTAADIAALTELNDTLGSQGYLLQTAVPLRTRFVESRRTHVPSIIDDPEGDLARAYSDLADEITERIEA